MGFIGLDVKSLNRRNQRFGDGKGQQVLRVQPFQFHGNGRSGQRQVGDQFGGAFQRRGHRLVDEGSFEFGSHLGPFVDAEGILDVTEKQPCTFMNVGGLLKRDDTGRGEKRSGDSILDVIVLFACGGNPKLGINRFDHGFQGFKKKGLGCFF